MFLYQNLDFRLDWVKLNKMNGRVFQIIYNSIKINDWLLNRKINIEATILKFLSQFLQTIESELDRISPFNHDWSMGKESGARALRTLFPSLYCIAIVSKNVYPRERRVCVQVFHRGATVSRDDPTRNLDE